MRLDDVRVLDLTRLLPGPYATQLLADAGADVVKVEDTDAGDYARGMPPTTERGVGAVFDGVNRGKRSVAVDLKDGRGRDVFYRLVEGADVVIEQFRPGVVDRLGVDYDTLRAHNPALVYCSLSGYGGTGPDADRAGHDLNYLGVSGLLDLSRPHEGAAPQPPGYPVADLGGGLFAAFAVVGALLSRELGGGDDVGEPPGEYLDVGMADVVASFAQPVAYEALSGGDPRPGESWLTGGYPCYGVYECADGRYVTLAAVEPKFWRAFCGAVGREDLAGAHMADDPAEREALREALESLFAERSRDAWLDALGPETATGPVLSPAEALGRPHLQERGVVRRPDDAPPRVGFPATGSDPPTGTDESVPGHGEHTDDLLAEAGIAGEEIRALREAGVVR